MDNTTQGFWSRLAFGRDLTIPDMPEVFSVMPPELLPPSRTTTVMDPDTALTISSVYRSVQILTTICSDLPLTATRNGEPIDAPSLIKKPDYDHSYTAFVKRSVTDLALNGNCFYLKHFDKRGAVDNLRVLDPNSVAIGYDNSGRKIYEVAYDGESRTYKADEIQHLRLLEVPGQTLGLGPIQAARAELTNTKNVQQFATNWFDAGNGVPLGTLNTDQDIDGTDVSAFIAGWYQMLSEGKTAVLTKGLKYTPLALSPEDLQWLSVQAFNKTAVSTMFGIPITYLNAELDGNTGFTYSNLSQINSVFYQTTLRAYLSEIEEAITACLPNRVETHFDLTLLLKSDEKTRFENYAIAIAGGWMTPEYVAEKEGLPKPPKPEPVPAPLAEPEADPEPAVEDPTEEPA